MLAHRAGSPLDCLPMLREQWKLQVGLSLIPAMVDARKSGGACLPIKSGQEIIYGSFRPYISLIGPTRDNENSSIDLLTNLKKAYPLCNCRKFNVRIQVLYVIHSHIGGPSAKPRTYVDRPKLDISGVI